MDPVVTARVPADVRARGNEILQEIGSNATELVNAAYAYVIREKRLPKPEPIMEGGKRVLLPQHERQLREFVQAVKVPIPESWADAPFNQLLDEAMEERYAGLR
jgi:antitoxin component of RelBE/YafQ-DinJ toxin-antitoxin module